MADSLSGNSRIRNVTEQLEKKEKDLEVLLALALEEYSEQAQDCPDPEDLAAWHEGNLSSSQKTRIIAHLSHCQDCYLFWSELAEPLAHLQEQRQKQVVAQVDAGKSFISRLVELLKPGPWLYGAGMGGALAAALVVFMLLPSMRMNQMSSSIDQGFISLGPGMQGSLFPSPQDSSEYISKSLNLFPELPVPWRAASETQQAFAVGVRTGLARAGGLTDEDRSLLEQLPTDVGDTPQGISAKVWKRRSATLSAAGEWAVLLRMACNQHLNAEAPFWNKQNTTLGELTSEISSYSRDDEIGRFFLEWSAAPGAVETTCDQVNVLLNIGL